MYTLKSQMRRMCADKALRYSNYSSTIYFLPFNRLATTNLIHQGVHLYGLQSELFSLLFSAVQRMVGGWPQFLGFQMTLHFHS